MRAGFLLVTIPALSVCLACVVYLWWRRERVVRAWARGVQACERGEMAVAETAFRLCVDQHPEWASARRMLARALVAREEYEGAEEQLRFAVRLEPKNVEGLIDLAIFLTNCPQALHEEAIDCVEKAIRIDPASRRKAARLEQLARLREHPRFQRLTGSNPTRAELARLN